MLCTSVGIMGENPPLPLNTHQENVSLLYSLASMYGIIQYCKGALNKNLLLKSPVLLFSFSGSLRSLWLHAKRGSKEWGIAS